MMHQILLREFPQRVEYSVWWDGDRLAGHRGYLGADDCRFPVREATAEEQKALRHPAQERHKFRLLVERERRSRSGETRSKAVWKGEGRCLDCGAAREANRVRCRPCLDRASAEKRVRLWNKAREREVRLAALQRRPVNSQVHEMVRA